MTINKQSSAPAKGNKNGSASKSNSAPTSKLKNVKTKDDSPLSIEQSFLKPDYWTKAVTKEHLYSKAGHVFRFFNTRRKQTDETYHITFDESTDAIKFTKPSDENITIAEYERYPPDEYLHPYEPSQRYQINSNVVSFIDPYEIPKPVVIETYVSSDKHDQVDQNDQNDQNDHSAQNDEILNDDHSEHSNHKNDNHIIDNLPNTKDVHTSEALSSPAENALVTNTIPIQTDPFLSILSMASLAPQDRWSQDKHIELVNIIGDLGAGMLTRAMDKELIAASAHECLFVDFLSEEEPKKVSEALKHPGWVNAMQEELNQFSKNKTRLRLYTKSFEETVHTERGDSVTITKRRRLDFHIDGVTDLLTASELPHHGIDLCLQVQILYDRINEALKKTIYYAVKGRLRELSAEKAWATIEKLAQYEDEGWNDPIIPEEGSLDYENPNIDHLLGVMEYKVDMLMKDAILLIGRSEGAQEDNPPPPKKSRWKKRFEGSRYSKMAYTKCAMILLQDAPFTSRTSLIGNSSLAKVLINLSSSPSTTTLSPAPNGNDPKHSGVRFRLGSEQKEHFLLELGWIVSLYTKRKSRENVTLNGLSRAETVKANALSIEPLPHVFKKKSLIAMRVIMELHNRACFWLATQEVEEDDKAAEGKREEWANWMYDHTVLQFDPFPRREADYPPYGYHGYVPLGYEYQANPKVSHLIAIKRIFIYLKGTPSLGLWYPKCLGFDLKGYSDSDYDGCNMDTKSTSGACQLLRGKLVCWSAKKQQSVAMSSAEAEYVVAVGCCANILSMKSQLTNYDIIYEKVPIFCDNTSAIAISNNLVMHSRTKHIDIKYHFIRDHILKGDSELHFIPTQYQLADIFTKPLDEPTFKRLICELGMLNIDGSKPEPSIESSDENLRGSAF
ncbi:hypothetical protein Tco_1238748 [Tanacetum coccineum]